MDSTERRVDVSLEHDTLRSLLAGGFRLLAARPVATRLRSTRPVLWHATTGSLSAHNTVTLPPVRRGFSSSTRIADGARVEVGFSARLERGETFTLQPGGVAQRTLAPATASLAFANATDQTFTCGIATDSSDTEDGATPLCVFPVYGSTLVEAAPCPQVLLWFAATDIQPGAILERWFDRTAPTSRSTSLLVDLAGGDQRQVSFSLASGWQWGDAPWARQLGVEEDPIPLLNPSHLTASLQSEEVAG